MTLLMKRNCWQRVPKKVMLFHFSARFVSSHRFTFCQAWRFLCTHTILSSSQVYMQAIVCLTFYLHGSCSKHLNPASSIKLKTSLIFQLTKLPHHEVFKANFYLFHKKFGNVVWEQHREGDLRQFYFTSSSLPRLLCIQ